MTNPPVNPSSSSTGPSAASGVAAVQAQGPRWLRYVAMLTGVLAALGGFLTVRSANLSNEAIYRSTQAVMCQSQASDAWAEFQAQSVKARIIETQLAAASGDSAARQGLQSVAAELRDRQPTLQAKARQMEAQRDSLLAAGERRLAEKDLLGYAGMGTQLAIALASVAALVRRPAAFGAAILAALAAAAITAWVLLSHYTGS